jgi:hypothetical protein
MLPIVATLLTQGLSVLGNAVLAKGQKEIEERLGISLEDSVQTEEGKIKLRQLEFEHEEFLITAAQKEREHELESNKIYLADTASARNLGIELSKSTSFLNQNIMPILALITVFGGAVILFISEEAEIRMAAVSMMTMVLAYFFGSSQGSKDKQEHIRRLEGIK